MRHVALDTETTGFSPGSDRVIEVGLVTIERRQIVDRWSQRINPERPIPQAATGVHGITDADVAGMPTMRDVWPEIAKRIEGATLIAHNAGFDRRMLEAECAAIDAEKLGNEFIDTMTESRRLWPRSHANLDALCARLSIKSDRGLHGALEDAELTALCWLAMTREQLEITVGAVGVDMASGDDSCAVVVVDGGVIRLPTAEEVAAHDSITRQLARVPGGPWWTQ